MGQRISGKLRRPGTLAEELARSKRIQDEAVSLAERMSSRGTEKVRPEEVQVLLDRGVSALAIEDDLSRGRSLQQIKEEYLPSLEKKITATAETNYVPDPSKPVWAAEAKPVWAAEAKPAWPMESSTTTEQIPSRLDKQMEAQQVADAASKFRLPPKKTAAVGVGAGLAGDDTPFQKWKEPVEDFDPREDIQPTPPDTPETSVAAPDTPAPDLEPDQTKTGKTGAGARESETGTSKSGRDLTISVARYVPKMYQKSASQAEREKAAQGALDTLGANVPTRDKEEASHWRERNEFIRQWYEEAKSKLGWGEVVEQLANAVGLMAAGYYGAKTGRDLTSGLKFSKSDWDAKYGRLLAEYRTDLDTVAGERQAERVEREQDHQARMEDWRGRMAVAQQHAAQAERDGDEEVANFWRGEEAKFRAHSEATRQAEHAADRTARTEERLALKKERDADRAEAKQARDQATAERINQQLGAQEVRALRARAAALQKYMPTLTYGSSSKKKKADNEAIGRMLLPVEVSSELQKKIEDGDEDGVRSFLQQADQKYQRDIQALKKKYNLPDTEGTYE